MFKKNNLDEMQEQKLLRIEHNGCWLAFWGLLAAMIIQTAFLDASFSAVAGEWIVFMVLAVYMAFDCARNGIWDRRLKNDAKTNLVISLIAAVVFAAILFGGTYFRYRSSAGSLAAALIGGVIVFIACFLGLLLMARYTNKKQAALEEEPEDEEDT